MRAQFREKVKDFPMAFAAVLAAAVAGVFALARLTAPGGVVEITASQPSKPNFVIDEDGIEGSGILITRERLQVEGLSYQDGVLRLPGLVLGDTPDASERVDIEVVGSLVENLQIKDGDIQVPGLTIHGDELNIPGLIIRDGEVELNGVTLRFRKK